MRPAVAASLILALAVSLFRPRFTSRERQAHGDQPLRHLKSN
jgi:hypothetical protein